MQPLSGEKFNIKLKNKGKSLYLNILNPKYKGSML